jgi:hypothetical protein
MPRVSPAAIRKSLDTENLEVAQSAPRALKSEGKAKEALEPPQVVEAAQGPIDDEWAKNMAFNKEKITIRVAESTDQNAEKVITVWNNGEPMHFPRGQEVTCERRFVEVLMRARETRYTQKALLDEVGKVKEYQNIPRTALKYDFSVVRDESPIGPAWLKAVMAQV